MLYVNYISFLKTNRRLSIKKREQIHCSLLEIGKLALGSGSRIPKARQEKSFFVIYPQKHSYLGGVNICLKTYYLSILQVSVNTFSLFLNMNILIQLSGCHLKRSSAVGFQEPGHSRQKGTRGVLMIYHVYDP